MGDTYACTAHAVTWELQRQIINGNAEAEFNMGDTYVCAARAATWELRLQISIRLRFGRRHGRPRQVRTQSQLYMPNMHGCQ